MKSRFKYGLDKIYRQHLTTEHFELAFFRRIYSTRKYTIYVWS